MAPRHLELGKYSKRYFIKPSRELINPGPPGWTTITVDHVNAVPLQLLSFLSLLSLFLLLPQVQHVFDESPFFVPDNSVSIMNGTKEGNACPPFSPLRRTNLPIPWRVRSAEPLVLFSPFSVSFSLTLKHRGCIYIMHVIMHHTYLFRIVACVFTCVHGCQPV